MNHVTSQGLTPRMRPLSSRKSATLSIHDIGTSKVVCLIAELNPAEANERLRGRTHVARIIGIGHQRSLGVKGGAIIDLESAERAIRAAVDAAERMAKVEVQSVRLTMTDCTSTLAMRSAASTAKRMADSASSMSTTWPAFMPRER